MKEAILILTGILLPVWVLPVWAFESVKRPILYPNAHYTATGRETSLADIEDCWKMAKETGASETGEEQLSEEAASDAAAVAAAGAAAAAILGRDPHRAAVAGAAAGGAASIATGGFSQSDPPPVFRQIVERCLFERDTKWPVGSSRRSERLS